VLPSWASGGASFHKMRQVSAKAHGRRRDVFLRLSRDWSVHRSAQAAGRSLLSPGKALSAKLQQVKYLRAISLQQAHAGVRVTTNL
jgi:hypothetical protein